MITDYSSLQSAIVDWLGNSGLSTLAPTFIQLAEARMNRLLFGLDDEVRATSSTTANDNTLDLPAHFKQMRSLYLGSDPTNVLTQLSLDDLSTKWADATAAQPEDYSIADGQLFLGPTPDAIYTATMLYEQGISALSDSNTSNWLLVDNPDVYLAGSLLQAEFRGWNDERLPILKAAFDEGISEIRNLDAMKRKGSQTGTVETEYF